MDYNDMVVYLDVIADEVVTPMIEGLDEQLNRLLPPGGGYVSLHVPVVLNGVTALYDMGMGQEDVIEMIKSIKEPTKQ